MESCPSSYKHVLEKMDEGVPPNFSISKKRTDKSRNLEIGDLVMLSVGYTSRSHWPLGRIVEVYPDKAGIVRSVKVKTPNSELIRPFRQLYLLEVRQK